MKNDDLLYLGLAQLMIRTETLHTFVTAARLLSFTRTAEELSLTQSAVSQQIAELERILDVKLFARTGRRVTLTPAGSALLLNAGPIVIDLNCLTSKMNQFRGVEQGVIRVAATHTPGCYLLPHAIAHFAHRYPGLLTTLGVTTTEVLFSSAERGELDVIVSDQETGVPRAWMREKLLLDELVMIVGPAHPWAARSSIAAAELAGQPLILRQKSSKTRQTILQRLAQAGIARPDLWVRFEFGHPEAIVHAVMAGLGVGFVSKFVAATHRNNGLLATIPIDRVCLQRPIWMLRPSRKGPESPEETFCQYLRRLDWMPAGYLSSTPLNGGPSPN
jgi:DNA-binding transcriptional LysR family regulator